MWWLLILPVVIYIISPIFSAVLICQRVSLSYFNVQFSMLWLLFFGCSISAIFLLFLNVIIVYTFDVHIDELIILAFFLYPICSALMLWLYATFVLYNKGLILRQGENND